VWVELMLTPLNGMVTQSRSLRQKSWRAGRIWYRQGIDSSRRDWRAVRFTEIKFRVFWAEA